MTFPVNRPTTIPTPDRLPYLTMIIQERSPCQEPHPNSFQDGKRIFPELYHTAGSIAPSFPRLCLGTGGTGEAGQERSRPLTCDRSWAILRPTNLG
ncbi:MAG: hypothetical protein GDA38_04940 [Hormoscilla sp. SP12CHS1]|nr:hypothetical protein [Hormoscilla sp. SP12CHS1]